MALCNALKEFIFKGEINCKGTQSCPSETSINNEGASLSGERVGNFFYFQFHRSCIVFDCCTE